MATINDIRARAQALRDKTESNSITATEVGNLLLDLAEVAQVTERDGAILGIRKVYPSVDTLNADKVAPQGADGKPLRKGNLVVVYNKSTEQTDPNTGMVYIYRGDSWEMAGRLGGFDLVELISRQLREEVQVRNAADTALQQAVDSLRQDAAQADTTLQQAVDSLRQDATQADTELRESVTREATARIQDDANLLLKIQAEQRERVAADERLRQEMTHARQELQEYADKAGKVKGISRNGVLQSISPEGIVDLLIETGVDERKVKEVVIETLSKTAEPTYNVMTQTVEGGTQVTLSTERGHTVAEFVVAGGTGGDTPKTTYIELPLRKPKEVCQRGERCVLTYSYNHRNADGEPTGTPALLTISIQQGLKPAVVTTRRVQPSTKSYELDLSDYTQELGTIVVRITAIAEDVKRTVAATIDVRELSLRLQSTDCIAKATQGGHTGDVTIPYYISGAGNKTVTILVNGEHTLLDEHITDARTQVRQQVIPASLLTPGRNAIQMQAQADGLTSETIYFDLLYNPQQTITSYVGVYIPHTKADLQRETYDLPKISCEQYEYLSIRFVAYGVSSLSLSPEGTTFAPSSGLLSYDKRYKRAGLHTLTLSGTNVSKSLHIDVLPSAIGGGDSEVALVCDLDADGRSNHEAGKDSWVSGAVTTSFDGVDWVSSGWESGALCLRGGASAQVHYTPFAPANDPIAKGWTMEVELRTDTVLDEDKAVVSCLHQGLGVAIYPSKAVLLTGKESTIETEEGQFTIKGGVERALSTATYTRIVFVVHTKAAHRLMELYANGVRIAAAIYPPDGSLVQSQPQPLTLTSSDANVCIRQIKAYDRALSDDEILANYMVSRTTAQEMQEIRERNDVLGTQGNYEAPRTHKRGRLFVKREGGLIPVYQSTNKKEMFACQEIRYESPYGVEYDFVATNVSISIQGTSSTKYPWKNIRIYLDKGSDAQLMVGGQVVESKKYKMSPTAKPVGIITLKCDYSDSSMTHNTGFARLWHQLCQQLGILTPAQQADPTARTSIEGYPCDLYNQEADGSYLYYGQYNFNNDKSKSDAVFGMDNLREEVGAMSLEMLNNTQPLCLFKTEAAEDYAQFDQAIEFNIPGIKSWAKAKEIYRTKIRRLWGWIGECARAVGMSMDKASDYYEEVSKFVSPRFKREVGNYFDVDNLLLWYLLTDYLALVDQRAKNMILRTWDGDKWYFTYYDGDTALGVRNDSMLAYLYDVERGTRDTAVGKYAFEGHDSWLWCLVLANLSDELRAMAQRLRAVMTTGAVLKVLNEAQQGAWSEIAYNKSGQLKYIQPATIGTEVSRGGVIQHEVSNYLHALQGDRKAHRTHFVSKRFAFLDALYLTDSYRQDNIDGYISRTQGQAPSVIGITASERYRYGYGTNNTPYLSTTAAINKGEQVELAINGSYTLNDPIRIYGASAIRVLDLTKINQAGAALYPLQNALVLTKCTALREIRAGQDQPVQTANFLLQTAGVTTLEYLDIHGIHGISVGQSGSIDLGQLRRLRYLDARGTGATAITLAPGAQLTTTKMPETLTTLTLRSLPRLTMEGLQLEHWQGVTALNLAGCPHLPWRTILERCTALTHVRIEGVDLQGDGSDLDQWRGYAGLSADGRRVAGARFVGRYQLTKWRDDLEQLRASFPEMDIRQAKYTAIEFDESIDANANITNLDNNTGARTSAKYVPSGHLMAIQEQRDRVLCKYDKAKGEVVFTRLNKADARLFADGTPAALDGTMGSVMIIEPEYWYKGINDFYHGKKYGLWTSVRPEESRVRRVSQREVMETMQGIRLSAAASYPESKSQDASYRSFVVALEGAKMVRWHSASSVRHDIAACFLRDDNSMVSQVSALSEGVGYHHGMYLIKEIPQGATRLAFCHHTKQLWEDVLLYDHTDILESEPDWVHHPACLVGAVLTSSSVTGEYQAVAGGNVVDFTDQAAQAVSAKMGAGWSALSYEVWKDIVLYIMAMRGERTCFAEVPYSRSTGDSLGEDMRHIYYIKNISDAPSKAYYQAAGIEQQTKTPHLLGYESWIGYKDQRVVGVSQAHGYNHNGSYSAFVLGGRKIPEIYIAQWNRVTSGDRNKTKSVIHGRYMDVLSASTGASGYYLNYCSDIGFAANESNVTSFVVCLSSIRWSRNLVCLLYMSPNQADVKSRLQYTGRMREVSNQEYKDLWR